MFGQNNQSQGFGGAPNQGNTGSLFGGGGSLFQSNQVASSFAQPQNFAAPAASSFGAPSQFGGSSSFGGASPFGGAQQNTGIFGDNQNANQQQNQVGLFGQSNSGFGQQQQNTQAQGFGNLGGQGTSQSIFGGQATSSQGLFGAQAQGGLFSAQTQNTGLFGQNNQQASSQFSAVNKPVFGGIGQSSFGGQNQASSFFGGQQSGFIQNQNQPQLYGTNSLGQSQKEKINFFQQQAPIIQQIHSLNQPFEFKNIPQDDNKGQKFNVRFRNLRVEPQFQNMSQQMLRFIDLISRQKGEIIECPEWKAQQEWQQKQTKYSLSRMIGQGQQNLQSFGNQIGSVFGQNQPSTFQPTQMPLGQQPQNQNSIFGQNQSQGLFQSNNQSGFNQPVSNQGGLFQSQQPQQPQGLFPQSQGIFSQPAQQSSGLFNQTTQNQQNQSSGIFGQSNSLFLSGLAPGQGTPGFQNQNQQSSLGQLAQQNKTSIFGQSNTQSNLGLFNQPQQPQQLTNTFSQQQQQPASLFQSSGGINSGGIFSSNTNPTQQQKQGSLFEQKPVQTTLFQNTQQNTQQNQGGLFSKTSLFNQPTQQSSLFPSQQNQTQSLFDSKAAPAPNLSQLGGQQVSQTQLFQPSQISAQTSLFSQSAQPNQGQQKSQTLSATSLFNTQQPAQSSIWNQPSTSSLFPSQQPAQQSLFNPQQPVNSFQNQMNIQQQTQQPVQMDQFSQIAQNFYKQGLDDPLGIQGGILEQPLILKSIDEEISLIQKESDYFKSKSQLSLTTNISKGQFITSLSIGGDLLAQHQMSYPSQMNEEQRYKEKQLIKESALDRSDSYIHQKYTVPSNVNLLKMKSYQSQREAPFLQPYTLQKSQTIYAPQQLTKDKSFAVISEKQLQSSPKQNKDVVTLTIKCEDLQEEPLEYKITVHVSRDIKEVLKKVEQWLKKELGSKNLPLEEKPLDIKLQNLQLFKESTAIPENYSIQQAGITSNCELKLLYQVMNSRKRNQPLFYQDDENFEDRNIGNNYLKNKLKNISQNIYDENEDESFRPIPPQEGYETIPSMSELQQYSKKQLSSLKSFTIKNIYGSIEFKRLNGQEGIDLTYVNLQKVVSINERDVNVYENCDPENAIFSKNKKPQVGQKLNLPAIITLNRVPPTKNRTPKQYEMYLQSNLKDQERQNQNENDQQAPEHLFYNHQTYEWQFKVPHFTKWGAVEDDDMEPVSPNLNLSQVQNLKKIESGFDQTQILQIEDQKEEEKEIQENDNKNDKISFSTQIKRPAYGSIQHTNQVEYQNSQTLQLQKKRASTQIQNEGINFQTPAQIFQQKLNDRIQSRRQAVILQTQAQGNFDKSIQLSQNFAEKMKSQQQNLLVKGQRPCWRPIVNKNGIPEEQILTVGKQNNYQQIILNKVQTQIQANYERIVPALLARMDIIQSANEGYVPGIDFPISQNSQQNQSIQTHISQILLEVALDYRSIFQHQQQKLEKESEKFNNEFYLISLMNILFGDPRIHLVKLHPFYEQLKEQGGYNLFLKNAQQFHNQPFDDLQDQLESEKIKRNSLIVLLKFICQQEAKVQILENQNLNEQQIYQKAYQLMVNGDIVKASKFLSGRKKHNIALILSQSLSATQNKKIQIRQHSLQKSSDENQTEYFKKIINLITFQSNSNLQEFFKMHDEISWKQCLCSLLMYVYDPRQSLSQVLKEFISYKEAEDLSKINVNIPNQNDKPQDLIYTLLKVFLNMRQENLYLELQQNYEVFNEINQFLNQVVKPFKINSQDSQIFWLVHLVLKTYGQKFGDINALQIQNEFQDEISVKYSNYLLKIGAFEQSFVIAMFIQNQQLRNQFVYEKLNQVQNMFHDGFQFSCERKLQLQNFLFQKLKIPVKYILQIQGNICQNQKSYIQSMKKYIDINDFDTAHSIFMQQVAPQYFGTPQLIQQLCKSIYKLDTRTNPSTDYNFKSQGQRQLLDFLLSLFKDGQQQVDSFSLNGAGMTLQVLNLLDQYVIWNEQKTVQIAQKVQEIASDLKKKLEYIMQDKQEINFMLRSIYQVVDRISQDCNQRNSNQFLAYGLNVIMCQEPDSRIQNHEMIQI